MAEPTRLGLTFVVTHDQGEEYAADVRNFVRDELVDVIGRTHENFTCVEVELVEADGSLTAFPDWHLQ